MPPVSADVQRTYQLYNYLCSCLAITRHSDGGPNFTAISNRLNESGDFRRTVSRIFQGEAAWSENSSRASVTTTGEVVQMLIHLDAALKQDYQTYKEPYSRILTVSDILITLYKLVELTPQERQGLGLLGGDGLTLLQQALLILQVVGRTQDYETIFLLYKTAVGLDFPQAESPLTDLGEVDRLIANTVGQMLAYLPHRPVRRRTPENASDDTLLELTQKAQREIRRLLARSGNQRSSVAGDGVVNF